MCLSVSVPFQNKSRCTFHLSLIGDRTLLIKTPVLGIKAFKKYVYQHRNRIWVLMVRNDVLKKKQKSFERKVFLLKSFEKF